jgi:alpha-L-rhamnosidase
LCCIQLTWYLSGKMKRKLYFQFGYINGRSIWASTLKSMLRMHILLFLLVILFSPVSSRAQHVPSVRSEPWKAIWITGPGPALNRYLLQTDESIRSYSVHKFRKSIFLDTLPRQFIIHVSADNRYKLYVNGKLVSLGPVRGDLYYWNYETVDLSPYLQKGTNVIAALVWNFAEWRPEAQITYRTGFILQGRTSIEEVLNTDTSWKVLHDSSYKPLPPAIPGYYVAGPGERIDMQLQTKGWELTSFEDTAWHKARPLALGLTKETTYDAPGWMLVPSMLPQMEHKVQRLKAVRKTVGIATPSVFPQNKEEVLVPPHTTATLLLDAGELTNAYPTLLFRSGQGAGISLRYAESLFIPDTAVAKDTTVKKIIATRTIGKGNRDEVKDKIFIGLQDSILSDGSLGQVFTPLWWRTYRYIELGISTGAEPLVIEDLYGTFTGYPFRKEARWESKDTVLQKILEVGWRTARLCAAETYMDCPYYEQLQYIGDTRIQALVSYYNSGDDRLARNALDQFDRSRIAEGITLSRWPSYTHQQIPTFSLWYIGMLYDYWWYRPDTHFVKEKLTGTRQILSWFSRYQGKDGSLKDVPYWNFTDWRMDSGWVKGMAPVGRKGASAVLDLQLLWSYQLAARMEAHMGLQELAAEYNVRAQQLTATIHRKYWDAARVLYADTEERDKFSQHANTLALLTGVVPKDKRAALARKLLSDTALTQASIYFKYYLHQALIKAGLGNQYVQWLGTWRENLSLGLTTWAEMSDVNRSRSDCHAWGASPNIELFRTISGIDSDAPGFNKVLIKPHLGNMKSISGQVPHPRGRIATHYQYLDGLWKIAIELPSGVPGSFVWKGKTYPLKGGRNHFTLK